MQTKHMDQNMTIVFMADENVLGWNNISARINLVVLRQFVRSLGHSNYQFFIPHSSEAKPIALIVRSDR